jgi:hypothetical protein
MLQAFLADCKRWRSSFDQSEARVVIFTIVFPRTLSLEGIIKDLVGELTID